MSDAETFDQLLDELRQALAHGYDAVWGWNDHQVAVMMRMLRYLARHDVVDDRRSAVVDVIDLAARGELVRS